MLHFLHARTFLYILIAVVVVQLSGPRVVSSSVADEGIRADLPLGGVLRVENRRGGISVEVWAEKHVSVTASIEGVRPKRSPVIIERTDLSLSIGVIRQGTGDPKRVDLILRIPKTARAELITTWGEIVLSGVPAELSAASVSGNIHASFSKSSGANVSAEAPTGNTSFQNCAPRSAREDIYRVCRMGAGDKPVQLRSERGRIVVASPDAVEDEAAQPEARKLPVLIGAGQKGTGAGTPSVPLTSPEEIDEGDIVRVDTELVTLNVSVIDRGTNRGLKGLSKSDFKLFEDGIEQQLTQFESANAPFNLVLLIDLSLSTQEKIGLIREAALQFVSAARPADRIGIVTFTHEPVIVSRLTSDRAALRERINAIEKPRGSTNVYDSVAFVMDEIFKEAKDSRRNAIVLMSDGLDSTMPNVPGPGSTVSYDELISRAREFDGVVYSLWLNVETEYSSLSPLDIQGETYDLAHDQMEGLSEAGGGLFYEVEKLEDLADAYERVVADLGTVYSLSYKPSNRLRDGKWRAIRVSVAQQNAVARGKRGYYAN